MNQAEFAPAGYQSVTPYFIVQDARGMIAFMQAVFDAESRTVDEGEDGRITHAEVRIGSMIVEISEGHDRFPPRTNTLHVFVEDTDACYRRALAAGAESLYEPADMPYGERSAGIADACGNHWYIATFLKGAGRGYEG